MTKIIHMTNYYLFEWRNPARFSMAEKGLYLVGMVLAIYSVVQMAININGDDNFLLKQALTAVAGCVAILAAVVSSFGRKIKELTK